MYAFIFIPQNLAFSLLDINALLFQKFNSPFELILFTGQFKHHYPFPARKDLGMQNIKNKELAVEIIQAYAVIKNAHLFYEGFSKAKDMAIEKYTSQQEFRKISNENKSLRETWEFAFRIPEGFGCHAANLFCT